MALPSSGPSSYSRGVTATSASPEDTSGSFIKTVTYDDNKYSDSAVVERWERVAVPTIRFRQSQQTDLIRACIQVTRRYNAEYAIPAEGSSSDNPRPILTPTIISEAVDIPAMRASSVMPTIFCPWLNDSDLSRKRANTRRKILASTYHRSKFDLLLGRFYRQLAAYGYCSTVLIPEPHSQRDKQPLVKIALRNPLTTYQDPKAPEDVDFPRDVGFVHQMSASWLRAKYPALRQEAGGIIPPPERLPNDSEMYDVLEWMDRDYTLVGVIGRTRSSQPERQPYGLSQLVAWWPNRLGFVPAVVPQLVTLDKLVSRLTHMIGKSDMMAYLFDLDIEMMERAIAPDRYVLAADGEVAEITSNSGQWVDGRSGRTNLISGARMVGELRGAPDPNNLARIDKIEQAARVETGITGAVSGSAGGMAGALRTGRGIDSMMSATVDPRVAELQKVAETSLTILNEAIFDCYKTYWPDQKFVVFSGWSGDRGIVEFEPAKDIETTWNDVVYPLPGTDAYGLTVQLLQLTQGEGISKQSMRRMHPWIEDPDGEERMLNEERIEALVWQALAQRSAQGGIPPVDAAALIKLMRGGATIEDAIIKADEEARKRQAAEQQAAPAEAPQETMPGMSPGQAAQPGLGNPGEGSAAGEQAQAGGPQLTPQAFLAALNAQPGPQAVEGTQVSQNAPRGL